MSPAPRPLGKSQEVLIAMLARAGDREAFTELVRRRQSWIRNLMRRLAGEPALADDLSQQVFLQAWRNIGRLQHPDRFGAWLRRLAVNEWLQHVRRQPGLQHMESLDELPFDKGDSGSADRDLDKALSALNGAARLCITLSYSENMTHEEIAELMRLPLGTVKSHIRRGTRRLQQLLAAYKPISTRRGQ